jgi:hypothetical protein
MKIYLIGILNALVGAPLGPAQFRARTYHFGTIIMALLGYDDISLLLSRTGGLL